jgi:hypothetical protein
MTTALRTLSRTTSRSPRSSPRSASGSATTARTSEARSGSTCRYEHAPRQHRADDLFKAISPAMTTRPARLADRLAGVLASGALG